MASYGETRVFYLSAQTRVTMPRGTYGVSFCVWGGGGGGGGGAKSKGFWGTWITKTGGSASSGCAITGNKDLTASYVYKDNIPTFTINVGSGGTRGEGASAEMNTACASNGSNGGGSTLNISWIDTSGSTQSEITYAPGGNHGIYGWADHTLGTREGGGGASAGPNSNAGFESEESNTLAYYWDGTSCGYGGGGGSGGDGANGKDGGTGGVKLIFYTCRYSTSVSVNDSSYGTASISNTAPYYNTTYTISASAKTGHQFVNWSDGSTSSSRAITALSDASYTANFELITYLVTFNGNGGSTPSTQSIQYNHSCTLPETSRAGYTFTGWYNSSGTKVGDAGDTVTITGAITFTAYWSKSETITIPEAKSKFDFSYFINAMRITLKNSCKTGCCNVDATATIDYYLESGATVSTLTQPHTVGRGYTGTETTPPTPMTGKRDGDGSLNYAYVSGSPIYEVDKTASGPTNYRIVGYSYGNQTSYGGLTGTHDTSFIVKTTSGVPSGLATAVPSDTVSSEFETYINTRMSALPKSMTVQQMLGALIGYTTDFMTHKIVTYVAIKDGTKQTFYKSDAYVGSAYTGSDLGYGIYSTTYTSFASNYATIAETMGTRALNTLNSTASDNETIGQTMAVSSATSSSCSSSCSSSSSSSCSSSSCSSSSCSSSSCSSSSSSSCSSSSCSSSSSSSSSSSFFIVYFDLGGF